MDTHDDYRTYEFGGNDRDKYADVVVDGERVCTVRFNVDIDAGRLELAEVDTVETAKRQGHASAAIEKLVSQFPDLAVINSPDPWNSPEGRMLVISLRRRGVPVHDYGCYRNGFGCKCGLPTI